MKHLIHSADDLGIALRAVRKSSKVRVDDLSLTVGVSKQTTTNLEKGKPTVQLGTVIKLLNELGLKLSVDIPESALPALRRIQANAQGRTNPGSGRKRPDNRMTGKSPVRVRGGED